MKEWFYKQEKLIKVILLIVPFINWIIELCVRWTEFMKKQETTNLVMAIVATIPFTGVILGYVDLVYVILNDKLFKVE